MDESLEVEAKQNAQMLSCFYATMRRKAEEWFIKTRRDLGHARLTFDIVILRPICDDCNGALGRDVLMFVDEPELVILLPEDVVPEQMRLYDRATKAVHLWPAEIASDHIITCSQCYQKIASLNEDAIVSVYEESFLDYFDFDNEDEAPKRKRGKAERKRILKLYGACCFECGAALDAGNFTLDHIVAQSKGGPSVSINLQPLCLACNQKKRDLPVETVHIALDMLLRPAPFESYEEPIW